MSNKTAHRTGRTAPQRHAAPATAAALDGEAVLRLLGSRAAGLSRREAQARLHSCGPNAVAPHRRRGAPAHFLSLLASPLSLLLLALAAVNFATGQPWGGALIGAMVVLSALLAFVQEHRSDRASERLRALVGTTASVLRGGAAARDVPLAELVPGDVVRLSAGSLVPADLRMLACRDLYVSQSALTGESLPAEKHAGPLEPAGLADADLANIAYLGSTVVSGTASAVVIATGAATRFGQLAADLAGARPPTAFDRGVRGYVWLLIRVMLLMMALVFALNGYGKGDWLQALLFAVAVAVGLAPEMLPMVVTLNLARGALDMAAKKVVVKRLNAIQEFGAMDVLCTDKTGTLTQDRVILARHVDIDGRDSARVTQYAYLNSYYQTGLRNLLDVAVLDYVEVHQQLEAASAFRKIDELPFDFERRRMSVILERRDGSRVLICKGAVEEVLGACSHADTGAGPVPLEQRHGAALGEVVRQLNQEGFRVIAVAVRELAADGAPSGMADETGLTLLGYIAFLDPPKDSAAGALRALRQYGVAIKVLTGDNDIVAASVCRHVGLPPGRAMLGSEVDALDDAALARRAAGTTLFAKMSPRQKARVIAALQAGGHVVGYLGDGINDGAALRAADVGISVDSAVDVAKESADIVLLQKDLMALTDGVVEGRKVFGNIRKYLRMSASSNFGNTLSVLGASVLLPFLPMSPLQLLLNNLLYDASQTALASDNVDPDELLQPRRWDLGDVWHYMLLLGPLSSLFDYLTFAVLWRLLPGTGAAAVFQTGWFLESVLTQTLVVHVLRTARMPFVQSRPSVALLATTLAVCLAALWLPGSRPGAMLGFTTLPGTYWAALPLIVLAYLAAAQCLKHWLVRRLARA